MELADIIQGTLIGTAATLSTVLGTYFVFQTYPFRHRITSQEELRDVIDVEALKLGLDPEKVVPIYGSRQEYLRNLHDGRFELGISKRPSGTIASVRHELKHMEQIVSGALNNDTSSFSYYTRFEPQATLYGWFSR